MKKLTENDPESQSKNVIAENIAELKSLFPEAFTEGRLDFEVLKQLLGGAVDDRPEKYGLNWHGKRQARQLALTPSTGTLRPCPEDSVDWDTTKNLIIEGDNLEVLKLLQKSYAGKVKLIYIDPPYNTGNDFVYPDNFRDNIRNYLELIGEVAGGRKVSSNTEASGRFHTDWLNMIYPRLRVAKNLLRRNGLIFISIDDSELPRLRMVGDDVFGEENFLATFVWKSRQNKDNRTVTGASIDHEYIVCYGNKIRGASRDRSQYSNPDGDSRGDWASANMVGIATADRRPNLHYDLINPATGVNYGCPEMGWRYEPKTMTRLIDEKRILWPAAEDGRPRRKAFLSELESDFNGYSTIVGDGLYTRDGTADIDKLFDERIFSFPKPVELISQFVEQASESDDIVLDFFAGSGTSGHAVVTQNLMDSGNRRYILVQLPEPLDRENKDQKTAAEFCVSKGRPANIAELTKERLRRVAKKIRTENPRYGGDLGFRAFKLASSNINAWDPDRSNLNQTLLDNIEHLKSDRSDADVLYELLLKLGLDLCVPIEKRAIAVKDVYAIGGGVLIACLGTQIKSDEVEELAQGIVAWHKELATEGEVTCVFRDSAFADDVAKTNLTAILAQNGLANVRSL